MPTEICKYGDDHNTQPVRVHRTERRKYHCPRDPSTLTKHRFENWEAVPLAEAREASVEPCSFCFP